jgi:hypothetical protein
VGFERLRVDSSAWVGERLLEEDLPDTVVFIQSLSGTKSDRDSEIKEAHMPCSEARRVTPQTRTGSFTGEEPEMDDVLSPSRRTTIPTARVPLSMRERRHSDGVYHISRWLGKTPTEHGTTER